MAISVKTRKFPNRHAMGTINVLADAAGTGYIDLTPLFRIGQVNIGIQIQTHGVAVTPSITMAEAEVAIQPTMDTKVPWKSFSQIASGDILTIPYGATVLKLVFAGAGAAYVGTL